MIGLPIDQHIAARETEIEARAARDFLARNLAWGYQLQCLRAADAGATAPAPASSVEAA